LRKRQARGKKEGKGDLERKEENSRTQREK